MEYEELTQEEQHALLDMSDVLVAALRDIADIVEEIAERVTQDTENAQKRH